MPTEGEQQLPFEPAFMGGSQIMAKPVLMSKADWKGQTYVSLRHTRSDGLRAVDDALEKYATDPQWPKTLKNLEAFLKAFMADTSPNRDKNEDWIRNSSTAQRLRDQIKNALTLPDPVPWKDYPRIFIAQDAFAGDSPVPDNFSVQVTDTLGTVALKEHGRTLLEMIDKACQDKKHRVVIQYVGPANGLNMCGPVNEPITNDFRRALGEIGGVTLGQLLANPNVVQKGIRWNPDGFAEFIPNVGASAIVRFNPADAGETKRGIHIALAHELVHAYHYVSGTCARQIAGGVAGNSGQAEEEMRTVGTGSCSNEIPSENWIRREWGDDLRTTYSGYNFSGTTSTLNAYSWPDDPGLSD
jgi:hypothetical protein